MSGPDTDRLLALLALLTRMSDDPLRYQEACWNYQHAHECTTAEAVEAIWSGGDYAALLDTWAPRDARPPRATCWHPGCTRPVHPGSFTHCGWHLGGTVADDSVGVG